MEEEEGEEANYSRMRKEREGQKQVWVPYAASLILNFGGPWHKCIVLCIQDDLYKKASTYTYYKVGPNEDYQKREITVGSIIGWWVSFLKLVGIW